MAFSRFRDRSGLTTRRRVLAYLQREARNKNPSNSPIPDYPTNDYTDNPGDDPNDTDFYFVDENGNYLVDDSGFYFVDGRGSNAQASLI